MSMKVTPSTGFSDIRSATVGADASRHVRGTGSGDARAVFVNKSLGDRITDWVKRKLGMAPSIAQQRADGARAVRDGLINQFGVVVADRVMRHVAEQSNRTQADLMRDGVTVNELHLMNNATGAAPKKSDGQMRVGASSLTAAQRATQKREISDTVNLAMIKWRGPEPPQGSGPMAQAGRAYRALSKVGQNFVHDRLLSVLNHRIETGLPVDEGRIAKETLKLTAQAASPHFGALAGQWDEVNAQAKGLMGTVRGGTAASMIAKAPAWGDNFDELARLEPKASGKIGDDMSAQDKLDGKLGSDDVLAFGVQSLSSQLGGVAPVEAHAAYRRAMGTKGAAREALFAASLAAFTMPQDFGEAGTKAINTVQRGIQSSVAALGEKGKIDGVAAEQARLRDAVTDALNEVSALTPEERANVKSSVEDKVARDIGRDNPKFDREVEIGLERELRTARNRKRAPLEAALTEKGPFSGDPAVDKLMDVAMSKAGVADKSALNAAYDAVMSQAEQAVGQGQRGRSDSEISEIGLSD